MSSYSLDKRASEIVQQLLFLEGSIQIMELANTLSISKRSIYYDIDKINDWLHANQIEPVEIKGKNGIAFSPTQKMAVKSLVSQTKKSSSYVFTPSERIKIIICTLVLAEEPQFIEDFIELCQVSRNTVINDIKVASSQLNEFNLALAYENKKGYIINGEIIRKRAVFFLYAHALYQYYKNQTLPIRHPITLNKIYHELKTIEQTLKSEYVPGTLYCLALFWSSPVRNELVTFSKSDTSEIQQTCEYHLVLEHFAQATSNEQIYLALHLLGSRLQSISSSFMAQDDKDEVYALAQGLVAEFMRMACVEFDDIKSVEKAIYLHLKTSMYRYRYGVQLGNPMLDDIKNEYQTLFQLTKRACGYLRQSLNVPIPDSEIAYITLHFGGFMTQTTKANPSLKILIVCPNGLSTGNMLKKEVIDLLPFANQVDVISLTQYKPQHNYDVVIATLIISEEENLIVVHPILTDNDRVSILRKCMSHKNQHSQEIDTLFKMLSPYISTNDHNNVRSIIEKYFSNMEFQGYKLPKSNLLGLSYYLKDTNISFIKKSIEWPKSITIASTILKKAGYIEQRYIDRIIELNNLLGPCMFICDGVVLAHAKVEEGSLQLGISLLVAQQPIIFPHAKKASLIFVLSAQDQTSHLQILTDLMSIFQTPSNITTILEMNDSHSILNFLYSILDTPNK